MKKLLLISAFLFALSISGFSQIISRDTLTDINVPAITKMLNKIADRKDSTTWVSKKNEEHEGSFEVYRVYGTTIIIENHRQKP